MKRHTPPRALIALNAALLLGLGIVTFAPESQAQRGTSRARGEYTMISGSISGGVSNVVYIVDAANNELITVRWNESTKALDSLGHRDLRADSQIGAGR